MADRPRVAVFLGGPSSEHEVSLKSGGLALTKFDRARFDPAPIFVDRERNWHFARLPYDGGPLVEAVRGGGLVRYGDRSRLPWTPDVAFLGLHGIYGEDGEIQTELAALGIRYTGSGPAASRLAMNKQASKAVFAREGLPLAPDFALLPEERAALATDVQAAASQAARRIAEAHAGPWVLKPRDGGSSVGVRIVTARAALAGQLAQSLAEGETVIEAFVAGRELTCGVLAERQSGERALPPTEIVPKASGFFDFTAKYTPGASEEITPAALDSGQTRVLQDIALRAHRALGCRGYSRSDVILGEQGFVLLETNTLPGMTETSLFPQEAAAVGLSYVALLTHLVELALEG